MSVPKTKPTIPSIRLYVLACPILPASIAFTVVHAKYVSMIAGMSKNRNINGIIPIKGKMLTVEGGVVGKAEGAEETIVAKSTLTIRRPIKPATAAKM